MSASRSDLLNRAINALPFELHIPGYQFCGPGTRLTKRLVRGDEGINPLDAACREHDIAYSRSNDLIDRHADNVLADKALERVIGRDSALSERAAAAAVWAAKKAKSMGMKPKKKMRKKATKKRILSTGKTRRCVTVSTNVGRARILDRRSGQRGESGK